MQNQGKYIRVAVPSAHGSTEQVESRRGQHSTSPTLESAWDAQDAASPMPRPRWGTRTAWTAVATTGHLWQELLGISRLIYKHCWYQHFYHSLGWGKAAATGT